MKTEARELPKWAVIVVDSVKMYPAYSRSEARRLQLQFAKGKVGSVVVRKLVTL